MQSFHVTKYKAVTCLKHVTGYVVSYVNIERSTVQPKREMMLTQLADV